MFSRFQKREISERIQHMLRSTNHPELPDGEIEFLLHVRGKQTRSVANIFNNGAVTNASKPDRED